MTTPIHMTGDLEPRSDWGPPGDGCPVARALDAVGTRSGFLIVREAFYGASRFEEFVARTDLSEPVVSSRLRELTRAGIVERFPYREPGQRTRQGYRLTEQGEDLLPTLVALMRWGSRWLFPEGARVELTHRGCGQPVHAALRCADGHDVAADALDLTVPGVPSREAAQTRQWGSPRRHGGATIVENAEQSLEQTSSLPNRCV